MAAKIGLAAELAKQAAQAARDEVATAQGGATKGKEATSKSWTVPQLAQDFALDDALENATNRAVDHYGQALAPQGLEMRLDGASSQSVAGGEQGVPSLQATLREQGSGRVIKAYTAPTFLAMYAVQQQATGLVVDGNV